MRLNWETSIVQRDGYIDVYLRADGACVTTGGSSPGPYFTKHRPSYGDLPLVTIASPELIPEVVDALRALLGALESF